MELAKQRQRPRPPVPSPAHRAAQVPYPAAIDTRAARAPTGPDPIAPRPSQHHRPAAPKPTSGPSPRPPPSVQTDLPETLIPQRSPPPAGKKTAAAPKVHILKSLLSQSSAVKRFVRKELSPPQAAPPQAQPFDPVRSWFREALADVLTTDSNHRFGQQQSAGNGPPLGSAAGNMQSNASVASDDLLRDRGLCWGPDTAGRPSESMSQPNPKRARTSDVNSGVAFRIEEELFRLSGGVNEKYKEKGRSLLFNLKGKNNPVLRERVLSGDITPECLCAMTIEELASRELSGWRMAEAQELAKPVAVQKNSADKTSVHNEVNESDNSVEDGAVGTYSSNKSNNLEYPPNEKSDLPQIMSLDEFMQLLHSEPRSEYQPTEALRDDPRIDKADKALKSENFPTAKDKAAASDLQFRSSLPSPQVKRKSKLESPVNKSVSFLDPVEEPKRDVLAKSPPEKVVAEKTDTVNGSIPESTMNCNRTPDPASTHGSVWKGSIQFGLSTLTNMAAIFKSGEKPSTNGWPHFLEIKGRVRLSVFEEFLEHLPNSRSRAIMVTELRWKEGSLESGRHHLSQTIDSYIGDDRVGLVKPAEGVELYLCPSQGKAARILADHLPKEHSGSLTVAGTSIIGLVVWRRPHVSHRVPNREDVPKSRTTVSSAVLPKISQPPSRSSNACPSHQDVSKSQATISSPVLPRISQPPSRSSSACPSHQDIVTTDVLPGIGPAVVKDDDDLPEYNFDSDSNSSDNAMASQTDKSHQHTSLSEERMREMVRKYGESSVAAQPWNRDGDEFRDMIRKYGSLPEWNPNSRRNLNQVQIPQPQFPYDYEQQLQYHSMLEYDMPRELQGPFPQAYPRHQHFDMPVQHPQTYGHLMQPDQPFYYGEPGHSGQSYYAAPHDYRQTNGPWNQGLMTWNPW